MNVFGERIFIKRIKQSRIDFEELCKILFKSKKLTTKKVGKLPTFKSDHQTTNFEVSSFSEMGEMFFQISFSITFLVFQ